MNKFLPSKKFFLILLSVLLTLSVIYGAYYISTHQIFTKVAVEDELKTQQRVQEVTASLQKDTDNDGLKDWEEVLWSTDLNKADTDGDGRQDGEEVKTNHDPLNPSKNDLIITNENTATTTSSTEKKSTGDQLAIDFFSKYLYLRSGSESLDEATKAGLLQDIASSSALNINLPFTTYTLKDLKIISGQSTATDTINYLNNINSILVKNDPHTKEGELAILQKALTTSEASLLTKLDPIINFYLRSGKAFLNVVVPASLAQKHLDLINSFIQLGENISYMKQGFDEPILVLNDLKKYSVFVINMVKSLQALKTVYQNNLTN
ncbi:MAG: hypothetical protein WAV11_03040 [Minisyncoccia bacterium]